MFSLVILVRGVGGKLSRLVYLAPRPGFGSGSVISQLLLYHYLGIFSCKRYKHYFSQTDMFTSHFSLVTLVRGVGGKLSRLVYLAPRPGFESGSVISQFIKHSVWLPLYGGGEQALQAGLSCPPPMIWVKQCHQSILIAP